jgi:glycosyltransferase involved in cell wall biosynthesis
MKKILIITYYWPPSGGAGVQRWLKFVKYLVKFGYKPHVYTPENPESPAIDKSLQADVPDQAVIVKRKIFEPYSFYKKFTGKSGNVNASFLSEDKDSRKKLTEKISVWIRGNFFIPDARVFWVNPSYRFLKKYIKENNIDVIISTGPPHSMHLIAKKLKEKLDIKWIADFRDPWTNIDFYKDLMLTNWADQKHKKLEREVLQTADRVITIGNTIADEFMQISKKRVEVITNGFDAEDFENVENIETDNFTIVHIGSINADRNHKIFWQAISELVTENREFKEKLKIKFIGKLDYSVKESIEKYKLENITEIIAYVPHNEVIKYLSEAKALYLPLNNTPNAKGVLSGKLFEYLAVNKPIIAIGDENGDAANLIKETKSGFLVGFDNKEKLKEALIEIFNNYEKFTSVHINERIKYSREELTKELIELL